ncbi:MAG TPA: putative lipid II flippase FtsW [Thermodesulfobacteriota bacterium]|nr:putative lipid II flippase FtsW [Deltaproteobacteria bacterium]HQO77471.1 putative lipid II flippase FtsW [Thermodesulfobacteriota bacterium]
MSKSLTRKLLLVAVMILLGIGIIMVYSTSSLHVNKAVKATADEYSYLRRHSLFAGLGVLVLMAAARFPYQYLVRFAYPILGLSIAVLVVLLIPGVGSTAGGATRWISLGPVSFQPSECAKLGLIIFLAYYLHKQSDTIRSFLSGYAVPTAITGVMCMLVLAQPDFGAAFALMALLYTMLFVGGARLRYLVGSVVLIMPVAYSLIVSSPYRLRRITAFLDPWSDPMNTGFHIIQSYLAFGSGGLLGQGLGNSRQKLFYLPESHTDFILSVIGEELGLIGVAGVIVLFFIVIACGIRIAYTARDSQGLYLALGLVSLIGMQAVLNMGVVMGMLPTKGLTLPFLSYGGTSLMVSCAAVGILLNISSQSSAS